MPAEVYENLPLITIFAPWGLDYGRALPAPGGGSLMIYFAPGLERRPQAQSDFTVAHEFAHAALGHGTPEWFLQSQDPKKAYLEQECEIAADQLVEQWGYPIPAYRKRKRPC
jgi:hypothetical protein